MYSPPRKEIFNPDDMNKWLKSEAYQVSFLVDNVFELCCRQSS